MNEPRRNPFKPSAASVATPTTARGPQPPAPLNVRWAVRLYILSLVLCIVLSHILAHDVYTVKFALPHPHNGVPALPKTVYQTPFWLEPVADAVIDCIPAWLLYKVMRRRSWARIALTLLSGLALWIFTAFVRRPENIVPALGEVVLVLVALGLLFTPSASRWFKTAAEA